MRQLKISGEKITSRTGNINRYFNEVEKTPLMTVDEEFEVGMRAKNGDKVALEKLISSNLRFVISVAKQYSNSYIPLEELICQGNLGLCDAAKLFDPTRGFKFISFAVWHIRKEILMYINNDSRVVRLPQNVITDLAKIKRIDERIQQDEGRAGTIDEIFEGMIKLGKDITIENIKRVISSDSNSIPLESNDPEETFAPLNWIESGSTASEIVDDRDLTKTTVTALSRLNDIQRDIVIRRFGLTNGIPETFSTISKDYGKTPEWARIVYTKSLKIMKIRLTNAKLTSDRVINLEI